MNRFIIIIFVSLLMPNLLFSRDKLKNFTSGYYITHEGDTTSGFFKNVPLSSSCSFIKFKKDHDAKPIILYPSDVKLYKRGRQVFYYKYLGENSLITESFVILVIRGELSLYSRWVSRNNNGYSTEVEIKYIELKGSPVMKVKKSNYRKRLSTYLSDNKALSLKILNKEISNISSIVKAYNMWHNNGRKNNLSEIELAKLNERIDFYTDSKLALEVPLGFVANFINCQEDLSKIVDVEPGFSPDLGIGLRSSLSNEIKLRFGVHFWQTIINPSYDLVFDGPANDIIFFHVEEESKLNNLALYAHLLYEGRYAFAGAGFNIGLYNKYNTTISYYTEDGTFIHEEEDNVSYLSNKFKNQSHFELIFGLKINTKSKFTFKPFINLSIPFTALYKSDAPSNVAFDMYAYPVCFGVITEFDLIK